MSYQLIDQMLNVWVKAKDLELATIHHWGNEEIRAVTIRDKRNRDVLGYINVQKPNAVTMEVVVDARRVKVGDEKVFRGHTNQIHDLLEQAFDFIE